MLGQSVKQELRFLFARGVGKFSHLNLGIAAQAFEIFLACFFPELFLEFSYGEYGDFQHRGPPLTR